MCSTYDILIRPNVFIFFNVLAQSMNISYYSCVDGGTVISVSWMEVSALGTATPSKKHKVVYPSKVALLILLVMFFLFSCPQTFHTKIIPIHNCTFRAGGRVEITGHTAEAPHTEVTQLPTYLRIQTVPSSCPWPQASLLGLVCEAAFPGCPRSPQTPLPAGLAVGLSSL